MEQTIKPRVYVITFLILLGLLCLTWIMGYVNLGHFNVVIGLGIALTKAILIALFFMHLRGSKGLLFVAAVSGIIWLVILLGLALSDYATRI